MKCVCAIVLCYITLIVTDAYPHSDNSNNEHIRKKRGFRQAIVDRIGHGFGKRTGPIFDNYLQENSQEFMTADELVQHLMESPSVAEAVVSRFIDKDGDGRISTEELLGKPAV